MNDEPRTEEAAPDAIEVWARRVGRTLGFVVLFGLALYLLFAYGPH